MDLELPPKYTEQDPMLQQERLEERESQIKSEKRIRYLKVSLIILGFLYFIALNSGNIVLGMKYYDDTCISGEIFDTELSVPDVFIPCSIFSLIAYTLVAIGIICYSIGLSRNSSMYTIITLVYFFSLASCILLFGAVQLNDFADNCIQIIQIMVQINLYSNLILISIFIISMCSEKTEN